VADTAVVTVVHLVSDWVPVDELHPISLRYSEALNSGRGAFTMQVEHTDAVYRRLLVGGGAGAGIRVLDGGKVFAGKAKRIETDGEVISVAGVPLLSLMADRVALPEPGNPAGPWTVAEQVVSGEPVAAWTAFLSAHVGAGAGVRRLPKSCTVVGSGVSAGSVEFVARWSPDLLGLIEEHATASGVGIDVDLVRNATATDVEMVVTVRALRNNVGTVFDPDLGSVVRWRVLHTPDTVTHAYAGGSGDGVDRIQRLRTAAGPRRVERWVETSGDADAVDAAADAALVAGGSATTLEVELTDTPGMRLGVDWLLGDLVTIRIAGVGQVSDRVTAVDTTLTDGSLVRTVTVGAGAMRLDAGDVQRRLGRLEGR
jgi:hypothetical protein